MSVFAALDTDVEGLFAAGVGNMQRYGPYWTSTAGALRRAGFPLLDSEDRPHFDGVSGRERPPVQRRGPARQLRR